MSAPRKAAKRPASNGLLSHLRDIASILASGRVDCLNDGDIKHVRELGALLMRITNGEDAHKLLRQNERTNPGNERDRKNGAMVFWATVARDPRASRDIAVAAVRSLVPGLKTVTRERIIAIKTAHRNWALQMLDTPRVTTRVISEGREIQTPTKEQFAALLNHLRRKASR